MRRPCGASLLVVCAAILAIGHGSTPSVFAQEAEEVNLAVRRDFGFGNGSQIQGLFTLEASGPADLASVAFKIDDRVIGEVASAPFKLQFDTDDYPAGWHDLTAVGTTRDGRALSSNARRFEFVSADYGWAVVQQMLLGFGGFLAVLIVLMIALPYLPALLGKKKPVPSGAPRHYGLLGGAICPKCHRPFAIHWWGPNAGILQKYDRCDHCGRWSLVRRANPEQLAAAEAAELAAAQPQTPAGDPTPEETLKRQLDESRYVDKV